MPSVRMSQFALDISNHVALPITLDVPLQAPKGDPTALVLVAWSAVHGMVSLRLSCPNMPFSDIEDARKEMQLTLRRGLEATK